MPVKPLISPRRALAYKPFDVTLLADFQRGIDVDFDKLIAAVHIAHIVARGDVGADRRADDDAAVPRDLGGDETDAADIDVAVFLAEAQALREMGTHHITVEDRHLATVFQQQHGQDIADRRFARAAQAREPEADTLMMTCRVAFAEDARDFGAGEPVGQQTPFIEKLFAHLRAGDFEVGVPAGILETSS